MPTYTITLGKRDPVKFELAKDEAAAMLQAGFRFAEFNTDRDAYRLSIPHTVIRQLDRGIITFEQG
jgi:hypothetical protein